MIPVLRMWVPGIARPEGSVRAMHIGGKVRTFHQNDAALRTWRGAITNTAADLWGDTPLIDEGVVLSVDFWLLRPKSAKRRLVPSVLPDLDKLVRAVGDALTGIVFTDDARIVRLYAMKHYADDHQIGALIVCGTEAVLGPSECAWRKTPDPAVPSNTAAGVDNPSPAGAES